MRGNSHVRLLGEDAVETPCPYPISPALNSNATSACSKEAKAYRVKNNMQIRETNALCSGLFLAPSKPDMYLYLRINTKIAICKI